MKITRGVWGLVGLCVALSACDDGAEQAKLAEAKSAASAKAAAEEAEANKKADALRTQRIADAKAEPERAATRAAIRKDVSGADMKAMDLKERLAKLKGHAKASAASASTEYDTRRTAAERDLEALNTANGASWETTKAQTDKDVELLKTALDAFSKAVGH